MPFVGELFYFLVIFILYGVPEVREVSRNLPGARGFVVIEYGPILSHGDPVHAQNYQNSWLQNVYTSRFVNVFLKFQFLIRDMVIQMGSSWFVLNFPINNWGGLWVNLSPGINFSRKSFLYCYNINSYFPRIYKSCILSKYNSYIFWE